jgi:hypothetical protein
MVGRRGDSGWFTELTNRRIERVVKAEEAEADEDSAEEDTGLPNGAAGTPA